MRVALLVLAAGCWTGGTSAEPPKRDVPSTFEVTMERTSCLGACPVYKVAIDGNGRVRWRGIANVVALGQRRAQVPVTRVGDLRRKLDEVRFFERDEVGELPAKPTCVTTAAGRSCSMSASVTICSDTSRAVLTVRTEVARHTVTNDHCDPSPLDDVEALIDEIARTSMWTGERVVH